MRTLDEDYKFNIAILERAKCNSIIEEIERLEKILPNHYIRGIEDRFYWPVFEGVEPSALYKQKANVLDGSIRKVYSRIQNSIDQLASLKSQAIAKRDKQQRIINELGVK